MNQDNQGHVWLDLLMDDCAQLKELINSIPNYKSTTNHVGNWPFYFSKRKVSNTLVVLKLVLRCHLGP
jgi:hypothetical protein